MKFLRLIFFSLQDAMSSGEDVLLAQNRSTAPSVPIVRNGHLIGKLPFLGVAATDDTSAGKA